TSTVSLSVLDQFGGSKLLSPEKIRWIRPTPLSTKSAELAFHEALATPIGAKPFEREKCWSPAIIFSDFTRKHSPFISHLINMIEAKTDDIKVICAGGTHVPSDPDFIKKVVREDMNEVPNVLREFMKIEYRILDFVLNQDGGLVKAAYGDPNLAHEQLAENYSRRAHSVTSRPSALIVTVADGPTGTNLYQSLK